MTKATVEVLVDDLDGSEAAETVRLGWNGEWRELELSEKNLAALSKAFDKYWNVARPVTSDATARRRRRTRNTTTTAQRGKAKRDPKTIRAWAADNSIPIPARGRIPADIEQRYNQATRRS